jgi:hypothetical protein
MDKTDTRKTSLRLPTTLWRRAHIHCIDHKIELQELVTAALLAYLKREQREVKS